MLRQSFASFAPRVVPQAVQAASPLQALLLRTLTTHAPGSDPLEVLQKECVERKLCDEQGGRLPGVHWVFSLALAPEDSSMPPNLRTVGIERVSPAGIDFCLKRGSPTAMALAENRPVALLHSQGKFLPGQKSEQWRGEGICETLELSHVLDWLPHFTVVSMVGSKRLERESAENPQALRAGVSEDRSAMLSKSHATEILQRTRIELENGDISKDELQDAIHAFRLLPDRIECMIGSPDHVMWDRWEWLRDLDADGHPIWNDPKQLVPH